jgi:hypothetical protein
MSTPARTARRSGAVRMRRVLALAGCGVLGVSVAACESTEQESAKIGHESEAAARAAAPKPAAKAHAGARSHGRGRQPTHSAPAKGSLTP